MNNKNVFHREYTDLKEDIDTVLINVCSSGRYILGKEVECFEKKFASYLGVKHVVSVGNGMEALQIGMMASGVEKGSEIITTPLSAVATTLAVTSLGANPVFVDIDRYFHINVDAIEKKITKKTRAILPVHLYGQAVDMDQLQAISRKHCISIFEDACQSHGALWNKHMLGTIGLFGAFSFYPTKNLGCYGDGGAITTNNDSVAEKCRMLRNYGQKDRYIHQYTGMNSRMDELQAGILKVKLPHLHAWNIKRRALAKQYSTALQGVGDIQIPEERGGAMHIYHQYVIRTKKRTELLKFLNDHSIPALIHYPIPIHKQPCYPEYNDIKLPYVEKICNEIISLPIHPYMTESEVINIVARIKQFFSLRR